MSDVVIQAVRPAGTAVGFFLFGQAELTGGVGGWEDLPRPRRTAATEWVGTPAKVQTLPLLLDGLGAPGGDRSVEADIATVMSWGRPTAQTGEPPILTVAGPIADGAGRWVLADLVLGLMLRDRSGARVQQEITVVLREYVAAQIVSSPARKSRQKRKPKDYDKKKPGIQNKQGVTRGGLE